MMGQAYQKRADEAGVDAKPPGPLAICKEIYKEEGILVCLCLSSQLDGVDCMHCTHLHSFLVSCIAVSVRHCQVRVLCTAPCMTGASLPSLAAERHLICYTQHHCQIIPHAW